MPDDPFSSPRLRAEVEAMMGWKPGDWQDMANRENQCPAKRSETSSRPEIEVYEQRCMLITGHDGGHFSLPLEQVLALQQQGHEVREEGVIQEAKVLSRTLLTMHGPKVATKAGGAPVCRNGCGIYPCKTRRAVEGAGLS